MTDHFYIINHQVLYVRKIAEVPLENCVRSVANLDLNLDYISVQIVNYWNVQAVTGHAAQTVLLVTVPIFALVLHQVNWAKEVLVLLVADVVILPENWQDVLRLFTEAMANVVLISTRAQEQAEPP